MGAGERIPVTLHAQAPPGAWAKRKRFLRMQRACGPSAFSFYWTVLPAFSTLLPANSPLFPALSRFWTEKDAERRRAILPRCRGPPGQLHSDRQKEWRDLPCLIPNAIVYRGADGAITRLTKEYFPSEAEFRFLESLV